MAESMNGQLHAPHIAANGSRSRVILAQAVEHRSTDPLSQVFLKLAGRVLLGGVEQRAQQTDEAVLHEIVQGNTRRQSSQQRFGDRFDQRRVLGDQPVTLAFG